MADDEEKTEIQEQPKSNKMMIIIIAILVVLMLLGGVGAFFMMAGGESPDGVEDEGVSQAAAIYYDLKPPFVVNYNWNNRQHFVQIGVSIMTRNDETIAVLKKHAPLVKDNLRTLFGSQDFEEIRTQEGKELLRQSTLEALQGIVNDEMGEEGVEQVFFTSFVMQ